MTLQLAPSARGVRRRGHRRRPSRDVDDATFAEIEQAWHRYSILLFRNVDVDAGRSTSRSRGASVRCTSWSRRSSTCPAIRKCWSSPTPRRTTSRSASSARAGAGIPTARTRSCPTRARSSTRWSCRRSTATRCTPTPTPRSTRCPTTCARKIMGRRACFSRARFHEVYYPHLGPLTEAQKEARPDVWHPIARRHPYSGWTSLYIGRWAYRIEGMDDGEAQELIDYLKDFAIAARVRLSPQVARRRRAPVGQPLRAALRDAVGRLEVHAPHAAHDARRRSADHGRARGAAAELALNDRA